MCDGTGRCIAESRTTGDTRILLKSPHSDVAPRPSQADKPEIMKSQSSLQEHEVRTSLQCGLNRAGNYIIISFNEKIKVGVG